MKVPSLKHVLLNQLETALSQNCEESTARFTDFSYKKNDVSDAIVANSEHLSIDWQQIPLKKKQNILPVLYTSALVKRIVASGLTASGETPLEASRRLINRLNQARASLSSKLSDELLESWRQPLSIEAQLWLAFQIETQRPGWIAFRLTPAGTHQWLMYLSNFGLKTPVVPARGARLKGKPSDQQAADWLWQAQYAYACCCRRLRQYQQQWPQLDSQRPNSQLDCRDNEHSFQTFQSQRSEQSLVHALVSTADDLFWIPYRWPDRQYLLLLKSVVPLCQAFERFERTYSSGLTQYSAIGHLEAMAMRSHTLLLLKATEKILKTLLEEHLDEPAPERL